MRLCSRAPLMTIEDPVVGIAGGTLESNDARVLALLVGVAAAIAPCRSWARAEYPRHRGQSAGRTQTTMIFPGASEL